MEDSTRGIKGLVKNHKGLDKSHQELDKSRKGFLSRKEIRVYKSW